MTMIERSVMDAKSDALTWTADARNRGDSPPPPELIYQEAARSLCSPGAATAAAILSASGLSPVPLGDDLKPSAAPLATFEAIHQHYRGRHHDGVGVELGEHPGGTVLVAQYATAAAWQQWQRAEGAEVHRRVNDYGRTFEEMSPRPMPRFVSLAWQPPVSPLRSTGVRVGASAIEAAGRALRPDVAAGEAGWLPFAAVPIDGQPVQFRDRKPDRHGVAVQATGVVPMYARRPDGSTLVASGVPMAEELPGWLVRALGGKRRP